MLGPDRAHCAVPGWGLGVEGKRGGVEGHHCAERRPPHQCRGACVNLASNQPRIGASASLRTCALPSNQTCIEPGACTTRKAGLTDGLGGLIEDLTVIFTSRGRSKPTE
eukprot:2132597-Rhodomonas_salina.2